MGAPHICCRDPSMELDANFSKHHLHIFDYAKKGLDWTGTDYAHQSPIDIPPEHKCITSHAILFQPHYKPAFDVHISNVGYTLKLIQKFGPIFIVDENNTPLTYQSQEFHFHTPSEHTIHGKQFPFEMHIVHTIEGETKHPYTHCVLGAFFEVGEVENEFLKKLQLKSLSNINALDLQEFMNEIKNSPILMYKGSLTTPPCTECVQWVCFRKAVTMSSSQLEWIKKQLFSTNQYPNARGVCPLNGRKVFVSK